VACKKIGTFMLTARVDVCFDVDVSFDLSLTLCLCYCSNVVWSRDHSGCSQWSSLISSLQCFLTHSLAVSPVRTHGKCLQTAYKLIFAL